MDDPLDTEWYWDLERGPDPAADFLTEDLAAFLTAVRPRVFAR